jgi:hypothetical protein
MVIEVVGGVLEEKALAHCNLQFVRVRSGWNIQLGRGG